MRGLIASSIGVTCAAALALPLTQPAAATPDRSVPPAAAEIPGSTASLPLVPLGGDRAAGSAVQGVPRRDTGHFSLVGVVWDDPDTELHGRVQVRTRLTATHTWSGWQDLDIHNADHGADPGTSERTSGHVRGATAPLWVGDSDGVEVRVRAETVSSSHVEETGRGVRDVTVASSPLPSGLRLELVDPGNDAPAHRHAPVTVPRTGSLDEPDEESEDTTEVREVADANAGLTGVTAGAAEIPALDRAQTERELSALDPAQRAKPYIGPRPRIVTRAGWGADEKLREKGFVYTKSVKAAFVHHTATGNNYTCGQAPSVIRGIYRYHVKSMGWRDIGYNFLVDKCGNIYEGRAGGVAKAVLGAHTLGFNSNSMGIAVIGTYGSAKPASAAVTAVAKLTAWKLGLYGMNPTAKTYLKSGGGNLYAKGASVRLNVISGHRDGFATDCPGKQLYGKLGTARSKAAGYQGR
ncbi:N-acetylmuramoyl-L-alanine amidase [Streptomyces sp. Ru71]|uniref:peptidoglycan recognition protein family protein n=1 Tax=Streptomyces sp. Ru71 TaxID=2080746 RepID=UPI000CDE486E|nr:peptidoglycan recognition protein [Streptomyces sp. Ru71]POX45618.1 N-acetylmuramoyl-L-alanine amidase [Streptomyces sp. Ru71]